MVEQIRIYFEGHRLLKPGFSAFFAEIRNLARRCRCEFHLISSDSQASACRDFALALRTHVRAWNILLRDSEGPHNPALARSICHRWDIEVVHADSIFWMVQAMESWFHADKSALEQYYGANFNKGALKQNPKVEDIPKQDLRTG